MPIKNYTTKVDAYASIGEIQGCLARSGANKVMVEYDPDGFPLGIAFSLDTGKGVQLFRLTAPVEGTLAVFAKQKVKADIEQAKRTAWRNVRDWILAQMAYMEASSVSAAEIFLPYMTDRSGQTLYQAFQSDQLLLSGGDS